MGVLAAEAAGTGDGRIVNVPLDQSSVCQMAHRGAAVTEAAGSGTVPA
jgi:hypothetical protein